MATDKTCIDAGAMERAATDLEGLITDATLKDFDNLKSFVLEAGPDGFDAAKWLEHVVIDRRHGMIEHVKTLKFVFDGLAKTLRNISKTISTTDTNAAGDLNGQAITELNGWITNSRGHSIPPAAPTGSGRQKNYNSGDNQNPEGAFTSYDVDAAYAHPDDEVKLTVPLPGDKGHLPAGAIFDEYGKIITEANAGGSGSDIHEDLFFIDQHETNKPGDPEDSPPITDPRPKPKRTGR